MPRPDRPRAEGKFIYRGGEKLWIRGVTYGTFRSDEDGNEYRDLRVVRRDFAQIAANGFNAIRTYTVPPGWLLETAAEHGLRVMVGLPWEQHVTFLDDRARARSIEARVRAGVRACAGHPAVLCYVVGNEIPAPIVRWQGRRRVELFLERLYRATKAEDPDGLVTYVNYPTTEYLHLSFLDIVCFNVYLEQRDQLDAYLARLQNIAGERPLIIAEIGLDSARNGEWTQADVLAGQLRTTFAAGCAGAFVFRWTDGWHRGGHDRDDWDFGLTRRDRRPKPALAAVRAAIRDVPFPNERQWPRVSVVVCTHNGARTIRDCLDGLGKLEYPSFEVIVVDDGSTGTTARIVARYGFRLIRTRHRGLSHARNVGFQAATGEIVAYVDDDAWPDPHWLTYLADTFSKTTHAGVGGPNLAPPNRGDVAECVANAPGGPLHVLVSDREAEHIPGCNMAFRKACLQAIGGFDVQLRTAGDDVDVCWRLEQRGWSLGFNAAAMVWHLRRNSVRAYWRQQVGYGRAEALLERKWPQKYNTAGHLAWRGRVYGRGLTRSLGRQGRIYHGTWGAAPFQRLYRSAPGALGALPLMPEWWLVVASLAALSGLGVHWTPLLLALPLFCLAIGIPVVQAGVSAAQAPFTCVSRSRALKLRFLTALLHLLQPLARLHGRLRHGLTPWRRRNGRSLAFPQVRRSRIWSERWRAPGATLEAVEAALQAHGARVVRGGDFDRWDFEVRGGLLGGARTRMTVEEHGAGRQLIRFRSWPRASTVALVLVPL